MKNKLNSKFVSFYIGGVLLLGAYGGSAICFGFNPLEWRENTRKVDLSRKLIVEMLRETFSRDPKESRERTIQLARELGYNGTIRDYEEVKFKLTDPLFGKSGIELMAYNQTTNCLSKLAHFSPDEIQGSLNRK